MLCLSLLELIASVVASATSLVAPANNLRLLVYMYFVVAAMPHPSEVLTFYHILPHMAIANYVTKASH